MFRKILTGALCALALSSGSLNAFCCSDKYWDTVDQVDLPRFMGDWYVQAGRFTMFEKDVHNALENYTWNTEEDRIDVSFSYNQGALDGPEKHMTQKGWVYNTETNAHWKVQPFWPFKFHYLIIALADDYSWCAIGVPNKSYLWIMTRDKQVSEQRRQELIDEVHALGYPTSDLVMVPQG